MTLSFCLNCGRPFQARLTDVRKGWGDFCSRRCKNSDTYNPNYKGGQLSNYEYKLRAMQKNPARFQAMQAVQTAIRNGSLVRQPCFNCGNPISEAHHEDYSKPLEVKWLCRQHHVQQHYAERH